MKIIVCVKQVPSSNERMLDPVTGTVIREGVESILNPFDAHAVEEAVRLKKQHGGSVTAISMGVPSTVETLRRVVAVGVDSVYLLTDIAFAGADTLATARTLALGVEKIGQFDLILCGKMATDGDTAQVGPMLAEFLGIPHVTDISSINAVCENIIGITRMTDDGYVRVGIPLPALITVTKEINVPKLPSITGVLRGKAAQVTVWNAEAIGAAAEAVGLRGSATRVINTARPERKGRCVFLSNVKSLVELIT